MNNKLYGIKRIDSDKKIYFNNLLKTKMYIRINTYYIENIFILEYLGEYAGRKDVIRKTYTNQKPIILSVVDEDGYEIYRETKIKPEEKQLIWEYTIGDLKEEYNALKNYGVEFEKDIYKNKSLK